MNIKHFTRLTTVIHVNILLANLNIFLRNLNLINCLLRKVFLNTSDPGPEEDYKKKTRRNRTTFSNSQLTALEKVQSVHH